MVYDEEDYYKPTFVNTYFKKICKYYESRGDRNTNLSFEGYIDKIRPYLYDMINDHINRRNQSMVWKIQLSIRVNFIYSLDTGKIRSIYIWNVNKEIMFGGQTHVIGTELSDSVK